MNDSDFPPGTRILYKGIFYADWKGPAVVLYAYQQTIHYYGEDMLVDHWKIRDETTGEILVIDGVSEDLRHANLLEAIAYAAREPGE